MFAIIPARGGSKGIPRKNIKYLCGKPLIYWTIAAALKSKHITKVFVSTDDQEIANISEDYGADIIMRPEEISGDTATSESAILHALDYIELREINLPEITVFLQCTAPLILPEDIDGTIAKMKSKKADSALTVAPFHYFLWNKQGKGINHNKHKRVLRQQNDSQFIETGSVYAFKTELFREKEHRFFGKTAVNVVAEERCFEIDEPADLKVAEVLLRNQKQKFDANPEALVLDFDGVFTDNKVIVDEKGKESVICNRSDGMALNQLNIPVLVITSERNKAVKRRCEKLKLTCLATDHKLSVLKTALIGYDLKNVVYVGNDVNDSECLKKCYGIVPADAEKEVLPYADYVLESKGGEGAIKEVANLIKEAQENENR